MTENKYILSICIPTRNRADVLVHTLDSIVNNPYFSDEIEVLVSDNASTDGTPQLMQDYSNRYANVKYYRQNENIGVYGNIVSVLDNASGEFLKLNNDYNVFTENGLRYILDIVKESEKQKKLIFFEHTDGNLEIINDLNINQIVIREGWRLSWMTSYGFWKEDWDLIENKSERIETMFILDGHFLKMLERKGSVCVCSAHFSNRYQFEQKQGGYNFFKVHTEGYLSIFKEYYNEGKLSRKAYDTLHYKLFSELLPLLTKFRVTEKDNHTYALDYWFCCFFRAFGRYPWFYKKMIKWILKNSKNLIIK